ncbi:hypothetical protein UFOVP81_23 [uncultured Caudovirales phage]|uniref:Scaffolding protein n=1 Tax=uncultured Caudovirales phage TaxID=2100421 RepID=A0A6J5KXG8_9CAUD|nr:hypothetical protein UFOVP81_23 [uncultured Caudovirales phage]
MEQNSEVSEEVQEPVENSADTFEETKDTQTPEEILAELNAAHKLAMERNQQLERQLEETKQQERKLSIQKPTLSDYNSEDEYVHAYEVWYATQQAEIETEAVRKKQKEVEETRWRSYVDTYKNEKTKLAETTKNYEVYESIVQNHFSKVQQGIILQGSESPASLVYALGKRPEKLKELSQISDPVRFAFALSKYENTLKQVPSSTKEPPPPPEKKVIGSGVTVSYDKQLEALRREAEKTGDYTAVVNLKQKMRKTG